MLLDGVAEGVDESEGDDGAREPPPPAAPGAPRRFRTLWALVRSAQLRRALLDRLRGEQRREG